MTGRIDKKRRALETELAERNKEWDDLLDQLDEMKKLLDKAGRALHRHVTHGLRRSEAGRMRDECYRITRAETTEEG